MLDPDRLNRDDQMLSYIWLAGFNRNERVLIRTGPDRPRVRRPPWACERRRGWGTFGALPFAIIGWTSFGK